MSKETVPIEDLVKIAIKEAMAKRLGAEAMDSKTEVDSSPDDFPHPTIRPEPVKPALKAGQIMMSKLFKQFRMAKYDFPVSVFKPEEWDERIRSFIPEIDSTYILDKQLTMYVLKSWEAKEKVLIYGPTGAGKSSLVETLCAYVGRPFIRVNCAGDMDSSMLFGQQAAKDGATYWIDGSVTEAVKYGAVFAWDEWDVTPSEITMGLQWLLEKNGKLFLKEMPGTSKEKFIVPHEEFRIVAIGNTQGQGDDTGMHSGTNVQNSATVDRFDTAIHVGYMEESVEVQMIQNKYPLMILDYVKGLVKFANLIRQGYTAGQLGLTISPRALLSICSKLATGYDLVEAVELVYTNKLNESHQKVAKELFRKLYGTK